MTPAHLVGVTAAVAFSSVGSMLAQAIETPGSSVVTVTSAGATASAVGALIYVARLMATGQLIAKSTADFEKRMQEQAAVQLEVNRELVELVKTGARREDRFFSLVALGKIPNMTIEDDK
jgi:hypothetical protein